MKQQQQQQQAEAAWETAFQMPADLHASELSNVVSPPPNQGNFYSTFNLFFHRYEFNIFIPRTSEPLRCQPVTLFLLLFDG